jgi:predicted MFS family arabinose efflux permease
VDQRPAEAGQAYSGLNFVIGVGMAITVGVVFGVLIGWYSGWRWSSIRS